MVSPARCKDYSTNRLIDYATKFILTVEIAFLKMSPNSTSERSIYGGEEI